LHLVKKIICKNYYCTLCHCNRAWFDTWLGEGWTV